MDQLPPQQRIPELLRPHSRPAAVALLPLGHGLRQPLPQLIDAVAILLPSSRQSKSGLVVFCIFGREEKGEQGGG